MDDLGAELRAHVSSGRFQMFLYWYKVPHSVCFEINLTWVMFFVHAKSTKILEKHLMNKNWFCEILFCCTTKIRSSELRMDGYNACLFAYGQTGARAASLIRCFRLIRHLPSFINNS